MLLPEGEGSCGGISTCWEGEARRKLVVAVPGEGAGMGTWTAAQHGQEAAGETVTGMVLG